MRGQNVKITKEILEKYNIYEADEYETYNMRDVPAVLFTMWPTNGGKWLYTYETWDESLQAITLIETEEELITALKFSKLYKEPKEDNPSEQENNIKTRLCLKQDDKPKYCSLCKHCRISKEYYDTVCGDEMQDLYCTKLHTNVHEELYWSEIAGRQSNNKTGIDTPPQDCPLNKDTPNEN